MDMDKERGSEMVRREAGGRRWKERDLEMERAWSMMQLAVIKKRQTF